MVKAYWSLQHQDATCAAGAPPSIRTDQFGFEVGLSDYEDTPADLQGNDIGMATRDAAYFPRRFSNIDTSDPLAADKIMSDYQVGVGGEPWRVARSR